MLGFDHSVWFDAITIVVVVLLMLVACACSMPSPPHDKIDGERVTKANADSNEQGVSTTHKHDDGAEKNYSPRSGVLPHICKMVRRLSSNQILAAGTIVLVIVGIRALHDGEDALEQNERAWIAPLRPFIYGKIDIPMLIKFPYQNIGKSVAIGTINRYELSPIKVVPDSAGVPYIDIQTNKWPIITQCVEDLTANNAMTWGTFAYPGSDYETIVYDNLPDVPDMRSKTASVIISGCFSYLTYGKTRHSPYCYFWQAYRDLDAINGTFQECPGTLSRFSD